jgi:hypothetical protein
MRDVEADVPVKPDHLLASHALPQRVVQANSALPLLPPAKAWWEVYIDRCDPQVPLCGEDVGNRSDNGLGGPVVRRQVEQSARRWLDAVGEYGNLNEVLEENPSYHRLFNELLPQAMNRLLDDPGPETQIRAAVVYNHVIEGTLALTGYYTWQHFCTRKRMLPGIS